jgi:hypothetical protein
VLEESIHWIIVVSVLLRCLHKAMRNGVADLVPLLAFLLVPKNALRWEEDVYLDGSWRKGGDEKVTYLLYIEEWNRGNVGSIREYEYLLSSAGGITRNVVYSFEGKSIRRLLLSIPSPLLLIFIARRFSHEMRAVEMKLRYEHQPQRRCSASSSKTPEL